MGNALQSMIQNTIYGEPAAPPPPVVLVPPLFERTLAGRNRMAESSYDLLFSKLPRARLFDDYYAEAGRLVARALLQPPEDRNVDICAQVEVPQGIRGERVHGSAAFRWQKNEDDPNTFLDLRVSTAAKEYVRLRGSFYHPESGFGVFGLLPLLSDTRSEFGLRYSTEYLAAGLVASPPPNGPVTVDSLFSKAWLVGRSGSLTAGIQYVQPGPGGGPVAAKGVPPELKDFNLALGYGTPGRGPLQPSFDFVLELVQGSKFIASYYHHLVVQRKVKNPLEDSDVEGITNYVDVGLEIEHMLDDPGTDSVSNLQLGASWQVNKNVLLKAKVGALSSAAVVAFKSWWQPSVTFAVTGNLDHGSKQAKVGGVISVENFGGVRYERADPNYKMRTPTRRHEADPTLREKYPLMLPTEGGAGVAPVYPLPKELRPGSNVL
ncbi:hypothetical protein KFL_000470090 [Klebsormidium nitens]|uniref:Uncharacterized protein n=1 Tax=Klebsormidium nitens TaxID=105231 RepID=A0A1Y1HNB6_KLENI|nr:hypothetical protein KFL_000470090 [Klebsormidium nitens]|eukprot:GAQ80135.1 hypothetical protein KFL_000470090 [Klebsormidium nitens]